MKTQNVINVIGIVIMIIFMISIWMMIKKSIEGVNKNDDFLKYQKSIIEKDSLINEFYKRDFELKMKIDSLNNSLVNSQLKINKLYEEISIKNNSIRNYSAAKSLHEWTIALSDTTNY